MGGVWAGSRSVFGTAERETGRHRVKRREARERKGLREELDKKQKLGGSETERGGHRGRQTDRKAGGQSGAGLDSGSLRERG